MKNTTQYQDYFIYKGVAYGVGTKVLFTEKIHESYYFTLKAKNQPHIFSGGSSEGWYKFYWQECEDWRRGEISQATVYNPDEEISEIVNPVYVKVASWQEQAMDNMVNQNVYPDIFGGVLLYVITMLVGIIFKDKWLIWIFGTIIFINWLLKQYRT